MMGHTLLANRRTPTTAATAACLAVRLAVPGCRAARNRASAPLTTLAATTARVPRGNFTAGLRAPPVAQFHAELFHSLPVHAAPSHADWFHSLPLQAESFHSLPFQAEPFHSLLFQAEPLQVKPFQSDPFQS